MAHHYRCGDRNPQTDALRNPDRRRRGGAGLVDARVICGILQASRVVLHHRHGGSAFLGGIQRLYSRMAGPALRSPALALACVAAGIVVAVLAWSQLERSLIPSFKETDVFVELQAPAGT